MSIETTGVRLTGDSSEFKRMLNDATNEAVKFGSGLTAKTAGKVLELKDVSTAVATALGINIENIAENIARFVTGVSKAAEEAWKSLGEISDRVAEKNIENMRAQLTEEQKYQLNLKDRERLLKAIDENQAKTAADILRQKQDELKLAEKESEIIAYQIKQRDELAKKWEATLKMRISAADAEYKAMLQTMTTEERIASLKETISAAQAVLVSGALEEKNAAMITEQVEERKKQLLQEQAKLKQDIAANDQKNAQAEAASIASREETRRKDLSWTEQQKILKQQIAGWDQAITYQEQQHLDATDAIKRRDEARAQLKDVELKKQEAINEAARILLKGTENLTDSEKAKLQVLTGQVTAKERQNEIDRLSAGFVAGTLTDAEKQRLAVLNDQQDAINRQLSTLKEVQATMVTISRRGQNYENQSTTSLEGVRDRLKSQLDQVKQKNALVGAYGYRDPMEYALQSEYNQVVSELQSRKIVSDYAARFGEDAARREYGDTSTDKALRDLTDSSTKGAMTLDEIKNLLKASAIFSPHA